MGKQSMMAVVAFVVLAVSAGAYAMYRNQYGQINWAQEQVSAKLLDGESARFRNVREVKLLTVCGEVNSKNRLGAYTGFTRFSVIGRPGDDTVILDIEDIEDEISKRFMTERCGKS